MLLRVYVRLCVHVVVFHQMNLCVCLAAGGGMGHLSVVESSHSFLLSVSHRAISSLESSPSLSYLHLYLYLYLITFMSVCVVHHQKEEWVTPGLSLRAVFSFQCPAVPSIHHHASHHHQRHRSLCHQRHHHHQHRLYI